jgi:hypothetical protein
MVALGNSASASRQQRTRIGPGMNRPAQRVKTGILRLAALIAAMGLVGHAAAASSSLNDPLLDKLVGAWVLRGDIAGKPVTHSVKVQWVLAHEYIQIRETSRSKTAAGAPDYDAIVYIGWDRDLKQYACLWLDSTDGNGLGGVIAHAKPDAQKLAFIFPDKNGEPSIQTTFAYDRAAKSWHWTIDNIDKGQLQRFANIELTRE